MERLFGLSQLKAENTSLKTKRYLFSEISDRSKQLIGISGARGVGKTILMLQMMKELASPDESLYISMDHFYFTEHTLFDTAENFKKLGGKYLFIDEVHKYDNWSRELKNIYDFFDDISIVFSSSSALEILKGNADLSRRAVMYNLHELSLREYLLIHKGIDIPRYSLSEILENHIDIAIKINKSIKPIKEFKDYLKFGAYPYINEGRDVFHSKLANTIRLIIENDLPSIYPIEFKTTKKLEKLLVLLSKTVPFKPNITDLSKNIGTTRNLMLRLLDYLKKARLIESLTLEGSAGGTLSKPDKIFLNNTNIHYALDHEPKSGTLRETFFVNQLSKKHTIKASLHVDFKVDGRYTFEIGGQNKSYKQIADIKDSYIAADDIEIGFGNKIPLWLFGFLY